MRKFTENHAFRKHDFLIVMNSFILIIRYDKFDTLKAIVQSIILDKNLFLNKIE